MASRVDLPQPDGPAIDRYSPFLTSKWMEESACVSTSSVTKTLLTLSSRINDCAPVSIVVNTSLRVSGVLSSQNIFSVQFDSVVLVVLRHVRENHTVSHYKAVLDLDGIHRAAPESHLHFVGVLAVGLELKECNSAVFLAEYRAADEHHIVQLFQLDGAIDTEIGAGAGWQRAGERHVNRDGAVHDRLFDARYVAGDQAGIATTCKACIDDG